jgi:hypothetical protein
MRFIATGARRIAPIVAVLAGTASLLGSGSPAHGQAPSGARLEISDEMAVNGTARLAFRAVNAPGARVGRPGAPANLSGKLEVFYVDDRTRGGVLLLPSPWAVNTDLAARFVNPAAPAGPSQVRSATVRPGRSIRVLARGLGGMDLRQPPGPHGVGVRFSATNAGDGASYEMCTQFARALGSKLNHRGGATRKLKLAGGVGVPCSCMDGAFGGNETGVDCGGSCAGCVLGSGCNTGADCESQICVAGSCAASSCDDGIQNGSETGVDCGGTCGACSGGSQECSAWANQIIDLLNQYRASHGKHRLSASPSMCKVADAHAKDLNGHWPYPDPYCNLHSWSRSGPWSACCYPSDPKSYQCMWDKPRELTVYPGNGYEVSAAGLSAPRDVLNLWKGSPGHNEVLLNLGVWSLYPWDAVGAANSGPFAVMWFGVESDPAGN